MKGTSRLAAAGVVLFTTLGLLGYLWANQLRLDVPGYGFIRPQAAELSVRLGSHLVWLDHEGREQQHLDIGQAGIAPVGDHAFFSNGDLLVYHRPEEAGFGYWLARYLRLQKTAGRAPVGPEGFYRCALPQLACEPYGRLLPAMDSAFRLALAADDVLFVADTPGFHVYRLSADQLELKRTPEGLLRFPNQLRLTADGLWVADTNNHRLVMLDDGVDDFGSRRRDVELPAQGALRWPHQFAERADGWLVNLANNAMRDGRLVQFDGDLKVIATPAAELIGDPLAFEFWRERLWVVDGAAQRLFLLDSRGEHPTAIASPTLTSLEQQATQQREHYRWLGWLGLGVMGLSLVAGFAAAWLLERKETLAQFRGLAGRGFIAAVAAEPAPIPGGDVYWLPNRLQRRLRWIMPMLVLVVAALGYVLFQIVMLGSSAWPLVLLACYGALCLGLMIHDLRASAQQRLGVSDRALILEGQGRQRTVPLAEVRYSATHLMADDLVLFLGNPMQPVFDRQALETLVFPRLKASRLSPPWAVWMALWRSRHPQAVMGAILIPVTLALLLFLPQLS